MVDGAKISELLYTISAPLRKANWKVVLLCFSTAATFWFFNALNKVYTTRIYYPIAVSYNKDSLVMLKEPPREIPINVTGGGWQLFKSTISLSAAPVIIEPENPAQTQYLTSSNLLALFSNQISDLNVNYIATDTIFFKIEPYTEVKLPLKIDSANIGLRENHFITSPVLLEPDSVNFRGPVSLIAQLPKVFTVSLINANISGNYNEELSLDMFSSSLIKKQPEVIHLKFDVEEFVDQATAIEIQMVNFPYDSSVFLGQSTVNVNYKVQKSFRNKIGKTDFLVIADLNNVQQTDSSITLEIMDLPREVKYFMLEEYSVKVKYAN